MDSSVLQYHLRNHMGMRRSYSFDAMIDLYDEIRKQDAFCSHKRVCDKTYTNKLSAWAEVEGGWLVKEGTGRHALFYVRPPLPLLTRFKNFNFEVLEKIRERVCL